ncbi:MAG: DEAD/DEAH box helicase [gamma proteobacterium symbiont of Taylorina sp.]|nr:DEAD/DEAH box helicase [gamma proteobacterium symbiont of Taylorina sp.]
MSSTLILEKYTSLLLQVGISAQSMVNSFSQITLQRGINYFEEGRVLLNNIEPNLNDNIIIEAEVSGSKEKIYNIEVAITLIRNNLSIIGECDCPVGFRCKHAVASILEFASNYDEYQSDDELNDLPGSKNVGRNEEQQVEYWLKNLKPDYIEPMPPEKQQARPSASNSVLIYVLSPSEVEAGIEVVGLSTRRLKKGGYGKGKSQDLDDLTDSYSASYLNYEYTELDIEIAGLLQSQLIDRSYYQHNYLLKGDVGELTLQKLLKTEKCFWQSHENSEIITLGEQRPLKLAWQREGDNFNLVVNVHSQSSLQELFYLNRYYYIDTFTHHIGSAQNDEMDIEQIQQLINAPPIPFSMAEQVSEQLLQIWPESEIPVPLDSTKELVNIAAAPFADVLLHSVEVDVMDSLMQEKRRVHVLSLRFDYDGHIIQPEKKSAIYRIIEQQKQYQISRDTVFEKACVDILKKHHFVPVSQLPNIDRRQFHLLDQTLVAESATAVLWYWHDFQYDLIPELELQGWHFHFDDNFHMQIEEVEEWYGELEEKEANDWFEISLGIELDGKTINLLPSLVELLALEKDPVQLKEKILSREHIIMPVSEDENNPRWVKLPSARIMGIYDTLVELYDSKALNAEGNLVLSKHQGMQLTQLLNDPKLKWKGAEQLQRLSKKLLDFKGIQSVKVPDNLKAELRDYQLYGLDWLQFMREYQFNGILADDMGLGKTVQALAHLLYEKQSNKLKSPSLVIAPTSLMGNWRREAEKFTPDLKVLLLHGSERQVLFSEISHYDIILTTYSLMLRDKDFHSEQDYHFVILDEAQNIKNARSKRSQVIFKLKSQHRLCLTGTPMENHLGELWSLFHFLMPGFLGAQERFNRLFRSPIEKKGDYDRQMQLHKRVIPFMLRRTKEMVATELPAKTEIIRTVPLSGKQRDLYETVRLAMDKQVRDEISKKGLARSHIMILDALLKLRQTCCDPRILSLTKAKDVKESAKLEMLMEMVPEMVEEGRKIIIFSQFVKMLDIIEQELLKESISYSKLTGQTRNRDEVITNFQEGGSEVFLISLKAGGVGLNLTAADTVIHYDPWWNPAVERQATDRAHRIGQDKPVFVYKLLTEETVEEKILLMQKNKQKLADALYQDKPNKETNQDSSTSESPKFSQDDLLELLKPLD